MQDAREPIKDALQARSAVVERPSNAFAHHLRCAMVDSLNKGGDRHLHKPWSAAARVTYEERNASVALHELGHALQPQTGASTKTVHSVLLWHTRKKWCLIEVNVSVCGDRHVTRSKQTLHLVN